MRHWALACDCGRMAAYADCGRAGSAKDIWLQLVEARQASGLTQKDVAERLGVSQAQVVRLEKQGYDAYTLRSLQRYLSALGENFTLSVSVERG